MVLEKQLYSIPIHRGKENNKGTSKVRTVIKLLQKIFTFLIIWTFNLNGNGS